MKKIIILFFLFFYSICYSQNSEEILKQLTLEAKIGQLFIISVNNDDNLINEKSHDSSQEKIINVKEEKKSKLAIEDIIKKYNIGGVHFVGYGKLENCKRAIKFVQSHTKIPLLISQDFEWGLTMRLKDALNFPKNMTLGAIEDNQLIYEMGKEIGRQCNLLGVHINYSPVVDVNTNPNNPIIGYRSFGHDKEDVAKKGIEMVCGLQDAGIIACAKHFCGHGDTDVDSHLDLPIIRHDIKRLQDIELYPFKRVIKAGVKSIMSAHIQVPALDAGENMPITLSKYVMTDILQKELGFNGLIITDALNMKGITKYFKSGEAEVQAFLAGNDILLMSVDIEQGINAIKTAILDGKINLEELDRRVLKILKAKESLGLFDKKTENKKFSYTGFHTPEGKYLKRKLFYSAITLVKDDNNNIPLKEKNKIALLQIGGLNKNANYKQLMQYYHDLSYFYFDNNLNIEKLNNYETIIISLFDLNKFAEQNFGINQIALNFLDKLLKTNKKIILTIFGNAYSLKLFNNFDSIIMAYEDDDDAQIGAAKVISGRLKAVGKLPI